MSNSPARRQRRAARFGHRQPTRMTEYQRNRQAEQPRAEVKVHAHLHGLDLNAAVELDEAGAFEGLPCEVCDAAIEWSSDLNEFQHHATKAIRCAGGRGKATPPDWYAGEPVLDEAFEDLAADDHLAEDLTAGMGQPDRVCRTCGCTDSAACDTAAGPCGWHTKYDDNTGICTACPAPAAEPATPPRANPYDTEFAHAIAAGLQHKTVYQGTVHPDEIERRRLRNRDANRSRRANRRARVKRNKASRHTKGAA
ncbi:MULTISPECIES: hypothetical protein [unclassified Mycobacterium]|uniref:hypothetical protein n=1 Tax=unclassified Mycobacterium TaxID=2642494 RepID=UPI0029C76F4F|nr:MULTISPECIES: hypothetical protein [unclassified Mycobacterium]